MASELRAQLQLLRALYQKKSSLSHNISQLKIKITHRQSNTDYKDIREIFTVSKILSKNLEELKSSSTSVNPKEFVPTSKECKENIKSCIEEAYTNMCDIEDLLIDAQDSEKYLNLLKEKHAHMKEEFERKRVRLGYNEKNLSVSTEKRSVMGDLEEEVREINEKIASFAEENEKLAAKKLAISNTHRKSVQKIKLYHQLSENAMRLRSKLLFKKELNTSISNAELELEHHFQRVNKEKDRLHDLEEESEENAKFLSRFESELTGLDDYIIKLESKLDNMYREREDLLHNSKTVSMPSETKEGHEDSVTVSLTSLLSGFHQMRKDKDSLIAENNRLKEKLIGLFSSKV